MLPQFKLNLNSRVAFTKSQSCNGMHHGPYCVLTVIGFVLGLSCRGLGLAGLEVLVLTWTRLNMVLVGPRIWLDWLGWRGLGWTWAGLDLAWLDLVLLWLDLDVGLAGRGQEWTWICWTWSWSWYSAFIHQWPYVYSDIIQHSIHHKDFSI